MNYTEEYTKTTLRQLTAIFHIHLELIDLHTYNTEKKMMKMLRNESKEDWKTDYILNLAENNKIEWIRGIDDPQPMEEYQKSMNRALSNILSTK
jgi:hypothetical protein